ncbi:ribokinase [Dysgonomonas termitidis]|uniref:Ribokinase n=1 Tax=Dysgonomonas termitidis TaxID=1516126 RepID=A0ABV9L2Q8_9BACT
MKDVKAEILVVGSTNIDTIIRVSHLPAPGETVGNATYTTAYGGKGANQAIATARSGGEVTFATNLGEDSYTYNLIPYFEENSINTDYIFLEKKYQTGVAFIFVADNGENCIAVAPGANGVFKDKKLDQILDKIGRYKVLLLQLEIPYQSVTELIKYAKQAGVKVVLNPAPARPIESEILSQIDILILNETEAEIISGIKYADSTPEIIAESLFKKGPGIVILTMGAKGAYIYTETIRKYIKAHSVKSVDTTAAGDTFCGAFIAHLMDTDNIIDAVNYATAAAAISVTKLGAQPSIPKKEEVMEFLNSQCELKEELINYQTINKSSL